MMRTTIKQLENLQSISYGKAYKIDASVITKINLLLAFIIIGLYPVPVALIINKIIRKYFKSFFVRY